MRSIGSLPAGGIRWAAAVLMMFVAASSLVGFYAFHQISEKHLARYLDELEWRFNNHENPYLFRDTLLRLLGAQNFPYQALTT